MVSLEQLKKDQIAADNKIVTAAKLQKRSTLKENQDRYEKAKIDKEEAKNLIERDERKLEEIENKKNAATSSLRNMIATIKGEYEKAKNDPNSLFRDFFRKDAEGNLTKNLDGRQVREIDEIKEEIPKVKDNSKEKISIQKRNKERKSVKENAEKIEEELYPKTKEYIKENYLDKNIGSYVDNLDYNYKRDPDHFYPSSPFKNLDDLAKKDTEQIENVKVVFEEEVEKSFEKKEKESGLLKLKENIEKINNFRKEAPEVLKEMYKFEEEVGTFASEIWDIDEVQARYSHDKEQYFLKDMGDSLHFGTKFSNIIDNLNSFNYKFNEIINLDLIKKSMDSYRIFMDKIKEYNKTDRKKISEIFKSRDILDENYNKIVGKENIEIINYKNENELYSIKINTNFTNLNQLENYVKEKENDFEKEKNVIKNYGEIRLGKDLSFVEVQEILKSKDLEFLDYGRNNLQESYLRENRIEGNIEEINKELSTIKHYQERYKSFKENLKENIDQKISFENSYNVYFPILEENIKNIDAQNKYIDDLNIDLKKKKEEISNLQKKNPLFGKNKLREDIYEKEIEKKKIQTDIEDHEIKRNNEIHSIADNYNFDIMREIVYSELFYKKDGWNTENKDLQKLLIEIKTKEKSGEEIYLKDYLKVVDDMLSEIEKELQDKQEAIKKSGLEEKLSEYKEKIKDYDQSVEELKKYYQEKNSKN